MFSPPPPPFSRIPFAFLSHATRCILLSDRQHRNRWESRRCVESNDDVAQFFRSILRDIQRFVNRVLGSMLQQCWLLFIFYLFMQAHSGRLSVYRPSMLFLVSIGLC